MSLRFSCALLWIVGAMAAGCGGYGPGDAEYESASSAAQTVAPLDADQNDETAAHEAVEAPVPAADGQQSPAAKRRIIYNATIDLTVADFSDVSQQIGALVEQFGGYISNSSIRGTSGSRRSGTWTVRVPVEHFEDFVSEAGRLGEINSLATTSKEVTAEYYDLVARIRNKQEEESRMLAILKAGAARLEDILKVEKEIMRVRLEVEQLQGRLRVLQDLTALSTVTINVTEVREYVAKVPSDFPSFGERVGTAWSATTGALLAAGQKLVIVLVTVAPWLPLVLVLLLAAVKLAKRVLRPVAETWGSRDSG